MKVELEAQAPKGAARNPFAAEMKAKKAATGDGRAKKGQAAAVDGQAAKAAANTAAPQSKPEPVGGSKER